MHDKFQNIKEVRVPYSSGDCIAIGNDSKAADCEDFVRNNTGKECQCEITITLNEGLQVQHDSKKYQFQKFNVHQTKLISKGSCLLVLQSHKLLPKP